ncbi:hypothetical protein EJ02DRAFT_489939 [Clathrospora elynae]|uniref:Uncharacterized protein n=1 Tax=Clathrospora elynae TaxID=706981 RepID=A0A6A5SR69_9PLEO|nr:hypothetical protein EJ02DRAFT_489939 [Clathrospora elynae]
MTADAFSPARKPQTSIAAHLPDARPADGYIQYDSEAEVMVGSESDDDNLSHPRSSATLQLTTDDEAARRRAADEPCKPAQSNIDVATRAQGLDEIRYAYFRSLSINPRAQWKECESEANPAWVHQSADELRRRLDEHNLADKISVRIEHTDRSLRVSSLFFA